MTPFPGTSSPVLLGALCLPFLRHLLKSPLLSEATLGHSGPWSSWSVMVSLPFISLKDFLQGLFLTASSVPLAVC